MACRIYADRFGEPVQPDACIQIQGSLSADDTPRMLWRPVGQPAVFEVVVQDGQVPISVTGNCGGRLDGLFYTTDPLIEECSFAFEYARHPIVGRAVGFDATRPTLAILQTLADTSFLRSVPISPDGNFLFADLDPEQTYVVQISQPGYRFNGSDAQVSREHLDEQVIRAGLRAIRSRSDDEALLGAIASPSAEPVTLEGTAIPGLEDGHFQYRWSEDVSVSGAEYMSYVNQPLDIEWLEVDLTDVDSHAASALYRRYRIVTVSDEVNWSREHAVRLLQMLERAGIRDLSPAEKESINASQGAVLWTLTEDSIHNDVELHLNETPPRVRVSTAAFTYASPMIAKVDGKRGQFFSNRLFKVAARYLTEDGQNLEAAAQLIRDRYGINVAQDSSFGGRYQLLPIPEEDRFDSIWQTFAPSEIIEVIAMLEEFPPGLRDISYPEREGGLRYMLRRANGLQHPWYAQAAAVAWPYPGHDYIEFLDGTFLDGNITATQRLIIHEKAHFLWAYLLTNDLKYEWLRKSGWYRPNASGGNCEQWLADPDSWTPPNVDPDNLGGLPEDHNLQPADPDATPVIAGDWASCSTTQFVTVYAAQLNPDEDLAESIAFFLTNPDALRARALPKYDFIRDYIMQGSIYVSLFRPDLTFQVFNLYPDYIYPGKINRIEIDVFGGPYDDKQVIVKVGLHVSNDCLDTDSIYCFDGAAHGGGTLFSPVGTQLGFGANIDISQGTVDTLIFEFEIPADAASGWWYPDSIVVSDRIANRRVETLVNNDFGWKLYIDNADPDLTPPEYVPNSLSIELLSADDPRISPDLVAGDQEALVTWRVIEERTLVSCVVVVANYDLMATDSYFQETVSGDIVRLAPDQDDGAHYECQGRWRISRFFPSGNFGARLVSLGDRGMNAGGQTFAFDHPVYEPPSLVYIESATPDLVPPVLETGVCQTDELDEFCLRILAEPVKPSNPDGETVVWLYYWAWEDPPLENASGMCTASIYLRDPQGTEFGWNHDNDSHGDVRRSPVCRGQGFSCPAQALEENPDCDANTPVQYVFQVVLPQGSAPGTWGLSQMSLRDHIGNRSTWKFTETLRFDVDGAD